jgi:penicillin-binding protein 1A
LRDRFRSEERLRVLQERLRPDAANPAKVWIRRAWPGLATLAFAVGGVLALDAWLVTCGFTGCPGPAEIRAYRPSEGGRILDREGAILGRITPVRRANVPLDVVPGHVRDAFIATEDRRFYEHQGLDWRAIARASVRNAAALGVREGYSTITMQVVRNTFIAGRFRQRSLGRKMMEMRFARLLEKNLTKDQILELYLNVIYLGNGVYGVEGASRDLFGKSVSEATLSEGAMLAALPKAPSVYTPRRDPRRARARRDLVLSLMVREGYISDARAKSAAEQPLRIAKSEWERFASDEPSALSAVRMVVDSVMKSLDLENGDVIVYTTLDATAQKAADRAVTRRAAAIQRESNSWNGKRVGDIQGAMVAIDVQTGEIRAVVGSSRYERGGFNRALAARRQPGSAFKPFVYAAAIATGLTPATMVDDEPIQVRDAGRVWIPANYGHEYGGRMTFRTALMQSSNVAAVRVSRAIGERRVVEAARRNGITSPLDPVPAIALGAMEVTPVELVAAYAPFANGGYRVEPYLVRRIESVNGDILWSREPTRTSVLDPRDAFQITSMLRSVVDEGTGTGARAGGIYGPLAGKTGTTNDGADVWFVGYTPTLAAGFWFGYDARRSISGNANGGRHAAPAWADFYRNGWTEDESSVGWRAPPGMTRELIDVETGLLAQEWCPVTRDEWFKSGSEPTEYCEEHDHLDGWMGDFGSRISRILRRIR